MIKRFKGTIIDSSRYLSSSGSDITSLRALHGASVSPILTADAIAGPSCFVFDIDGVLIRGNTVIPEARYALKKLYQSDAKIPRFPVAFLTNGGGVTERQKARQLSEWLQVAVNPEQVVLSHTPYRELVPKYANDPILVIGRGDISGVARIYGFNNAITTQQLAQACPTAVPFWPESSKWMAAHARQQNQETARPAYLQSLRVGVPDNPIKAIFVFNDPSEWYLDLQLVTDVLVGRGVLGRRLEDVPDTALPMDVYFSNPDLLWANEHPAPRFGQGAFFACVDSLLRKITGQALSARTFGKPNPEPYRLIENILIEQANALDLPMSAPNNRPDGENGVSPSPFTSIFAVGDNPAADVRGARAAGHPWVSILVRTGVFNDSKNCRVDPAHIVVNDVNAAVDAAIHYSRSLKWHSMR